MSARSRAWLAVALAATTTLAGCGDLVDIDRRALVVAVGVDTATAGGPGYELTVEYPAPSGGGGGGGGGGLLGGDQTGGSLQPKTISASGGNMGSALESIRPETSRFIYFGNLGVIAIGDTLAQKGVMAPLDYFLRQGEVAETVQVVVALGGAGPLLSAKAPEGVGLPMFEFLRAAERVHEPTAPNPLWRFLAMSESVAQASYLPVMQPSTQGQAFSSLGSALFRNGRMVDEVPENQALVLDWLIKSTAFPYAVVSLPGSTDPVTLRVVGVRKSWRILGPNHAALAMRLSTTIAEGTGVVLDDRDVTDWQQSASRQLQLQIRQVLDTLRKDGTDILGLADRVHARYPDATVDWPVAFSHMQIDLQVSVTINEGGRKT